MLKKSLEIGLSLVIIFICLTLLNLYSESFNTFLDSSFNFFKAMLGTILRFISGR